MRNSQLQNSESAQKVPSAITGSNSDFLLGTILCSCVKKFVQRFEGRSMEVKKTLLTLCF